MTTTTATTTEIPVNAVRVDDIVVRDGDTIPVDGHVIKGESTVNDGSGFGGALHQPK